MAFRIAPLQIANLTSDYGNGGALAANIGGQFLGGLEQGRKRAEDENTKALLGEAMKTGDFNKAGLALLGAGKIEQGAALLGLGQKAADRENDNAVLKSLGLGGSGSYLGTPVPRVAAPKQGVHVAETEDDVQRLERATGMVTTDADKQAIVKTVYGEAANQPAVGQQAVAAVIRNRANQAGLTPEQITQQRNQFEPWNTEAGRARMNNIPEQRFRQIAGTVAPVIDQGLDPTGGATHFYAPKAQAALGRPAPKWDNGAGNDIADHRFFSLGYGQGGGTPAPAPQAIIASAPEGQPAPSQVAQAPQGGIQPVQGDDPVRLRQEAAYYQQNGNPEAARQLSARADMAERQGGVRTAQLPADQPAQGAAEAQGFVVPGSGEVVPAGTLASNQRLQSLATAMGAIKDPAKRAAVEKLFQVELEDTKAKIADARTPEAAREFIWARRNGFTQAGSPQEYAREKERPRAPVSVGPDTRLVNPDTGAVVFDGTQGQSKTGRENADREAEADRRGLQGEARDAYILNGRLPVGAEKTTEGQANAALYADRMKEADAILRDPKIAAASVATDQRLLSNVPLASNFLVSSEYQQAEQAQRNFINATLRRESGAAISPSEFDNARKQYFPQPGDKPEVLAQKAKNRETAIQGIGNAAGPSYAKRQPPAPQAEKPQQPAIREGARAQGPNGQILVLRNNAWVAE